jgi:phytoene desaturase
VYSYWDSRVFAPSSLLFYVGFDKKIENISHHALFFDVDFINTQKIFMMFRNGRRALFYANFPS